MRVLLWNFFQHFSFWVWKLGGGRVPERFQSSIHLRLFLGSGGSRAASMASSNTFFNPFCGSKTRKFKKHCYWSNGQFGNMVIYYLTYDYTWNRAIKMFLYLNSTWFPSQINSISNERGRWSTKRKVTGIKNETQKRYVWSRWYSLNCI